MHEIATSHTSLLLAKLSGVVFMLTGITAVIVTLSP